MTTLLEIILKGTIYNQLEWITICVIGRFLVFYLLKTISFLLIIKSLLLFVKFDESR